MTQSKEQMARQLWLAYFNKTLLEQKIITEDSYRRMQVLILVSDNPKTSTTKQAQVTL